MSGIRSKDTKPELALRKALHALGFRYRLHVRRMPGHPDVVLPRYNAVVFVHGCFWHHHDDCRYAKTPSTRLEFWQRKFEENKIRDLKVRELLVKEGWRVATVWECALRRPEQTTITADSLAAWLRAGSPYVDIR